MHACGQVSIVAFKKGQLRVLSHAWDRDMGGRALDDVLFNHFAAEFQAKHGLDVRSNLRAAFRLTVGCEKVRACLHACCAASLATYCTVDPAVSAGACCLLLTPQDNLPHRDVPWCCRASRQADAAGRAL
jgi:heat shock protein 4